MNEEITELDAEGWFVLRRAGPLDPADEQCFETWMVGPGNQARYEEITATWTALEGLREVPAMQTIRHRALRRGVRGSRVGWRGALIAASIAIAAVSMGWRLIGDSRQPQQDALIETQVGQLTETRLVDGSIVKLDTDSAIQVGFGDGKRKVTLLRGRANFRVAHDAKHPFVVSAAGRRVTALGTVFDVALDGGAVDVILAEGRVRVAMGDAKNDAVTLDPGSQLVSRGAHQWRITRLDIATAMSWQNGWLIYDNALVDVIVEEMNRYSVRKIVLADNAIGENRMSARLRAGDLQTLAESLDAIGYATPISEDNQSIVLAARKKSSSAR